MQEDDMNEQLTGTKIPSNKITSNKITSTKIPMICAATSVIDEIYMMFNVGFSQEIIIEAASHIMTSPGTEEKRRLAALVLVGSEIYISACGSTKAQLQELLEAKLVIAREMDQVNGTNQMPNSSWQAITDAVDPFMTKDMVELLRRNDRFIRNAAQAYASLMAFAKELLDTSGSLEEVTALISGYVIEMTPQRTYRALAWSAIEAIIAELGR